MAAPIPVFGVPLALQSECETEGTTKKTRLIFSCLKQFRIREFFAASVCVRGPRASHAGLSTQRHIGIRRYKCECVCVASNSGSMRHKEFRSPEEDPPRPTRNTSTTLARCVCRSCFQLARVLCGACRTRQDDAQKCPDIL
jgi:hypothetical protein